MAHAESHELATLARMANQIASYFHAYPEPTAVVAVRDHIMAFWTPKMRSELLSHADAVKLDPLVVAAMGAKQ
jgi:formate dehydrogenase subunit delta